MTEAFGVSLRSLLIAGLSTAVVGAAVTPLNTTSAPARTTMAATVELASLQSGFDGIVSNLKDVAAGVEGIFTNLAAFGAGVEATVNHILAIPDNIQASIKNAYDGVERWPAYAAAWAHFSLGLIPGLWWIAPSVPLAYNTAEPLARAGVYSIADIVGLDPVQFARDLSAGIKASSDNAATYGKAWADSLVPVPTLPPYPGPLPGSPDYTGQPLAAAASATAETTVAQAAATSGIENAIKNTYNALEPWAAWGAELVQWGMGFVPGLWWLAPGVSLAYFTIEPLVQAGVYTFADVLGLNFAQIGPDVVSGIQQSAQNAVTYALAWLQSLVPFPPLPPFPPRPGAAVAPTAALRAAAAVTAAEPADTKSDRATDTAPPAGDAGKPTTQQAEEPTAPATSEATGVDEKTTPATESDSPAATDTVPATATDTPAADSAAPVAETPTPAVAEPPAAADDPAAGEAPRPSRGAHLGHRTPSAEGASQSASPAKADHSSRSSR